MRIFLLLINDTYAVMLRQESDAGLVLRSLKFFINAGFVLIPTEILPPASFQKKLISLCSSVVGTMFPLVCNYYYSSKTVRHRKVEASQKVSMQNKPIM